MHWYCPLWSVTTKLILSVLCKSARIFFPWFSNSIKILKQDTNHRLENALPQWFQAKFGKRSTAISLKSSQPILYSKIKKSQPFLGPKKVKYVGDHCSGLNYSIVWSDNLTHFFRNNSLKGYFYAKGRHFCR
jgi:hypothetical protein